MSWELVLAVERAARLAGEYAAASFAEGLASGPTGEAVDVFRLVADGLPLASALDAYRLLQD